MAKVLQRVIEVKDSFSNAFQKYKKYLQDVSKEEEELAKSSKKAQSETDKLARKLNELGTTAISIYAIKEAFNQVSTAANNYARVMDAVNLATQGNVAATQELTDWADQLEQATGKASTTILDVTARAIDMGRNFGGTAEQMQKVVDIAADYSTLRGIDLASASERITAALRGEAEAAEYLGLSLSETAVNNYMLAHGYDTTISKLSLAEQFQVRYNALLEQYAGKEQVAEQAMERFSGKTEKLHSNFYKLQQTIGSLANNELTDLVDQANKVLEAFNNLDEKTRNDLIKTVVDLGKVAVALMLFKQLQGVGKWLAEVVPAALKVSKALIGIGTAAAGVEAAAGGAAIAGGALSLVFSEILIPFGLVVLATWGAGKAWQWLKEKSEEAADAQRKVKEEIEDAVGPLKRNTEKVQKLADEIYKLRQKKQALAKENKDTTDVDKRIAALEKEIGVVNQNSEAYKQNLLAKMAAKRLELGELESKKVELVGKQGAIEIKLDKSFWGGDRRVAMAMEGQLRTTKDELAQTELQIKGIKQFLNAGQTSLSSQEKAVQHSKEEPPLPAETEEEKKKKQEEAEKKKKERQRINKEIVSTALKAALKAKEKGTPYVWGGNSLENGVDCSGLVIEAYKKAGIKILDRTAAGMAENKHGQFVQIPIKDIREGDLIFFDTSRGKNTHVGMALNGERDIEAVGRGKGLQIRSLSGRNISKVLRLKKLSDGFEKDPSGIPGKDAIISDDEIQSVIQHSLGKALEAYAQQYEYTKTHDVKSGIAVMGKSADDQVKDLEEYREKLEQFKKENMEIFKQYAPEKLNELNSKLAEVKINIAQVKYPEVADGYKKQIESIVQSGKPLVEQLDDLQKIIEQLDKLPDSTIKRELLLNIKPQINDEKLGINQKIESNKVKTEIEGLDEKDFEGTLDQLQTKWVEVNKNIKGFSQELVQSLKDTIIKKLHEILDTIDFKDSVGAWGKLTTVQNSPLLQETDGMTEEQKKTFEEAKKVWFDAVQSLFGKDLENIVNNTSLTFAQREDKIKETLKRILDQTALTEEQKLQLQKEYEEKGLVAIEERQKQMTQRISEAFSDSYRIMLNSSGDYGKGWKAVMNNVVGDVTGIFAEKIQKNISESLAKKMGEGTTSEILGSIGGNIAGALIGSLFGGIFGGKKQEVDRIDYGRNSWSYKRDIDRAETSNVYAPPVTQESVKIMNFNNTINITTEASKQLISSMSELERTVKKIVTEINRAQAKGAGTA